MPIFRPQRYAEIAVALGVDAGDTPEQTAQQGIERLRSLSQDIGIPGGMSELGAPRDAISRMDASAMKVTRLLRLNPRVLTASDPEEIYHAAL